MFAEDPVARGSCTDACKNTEGGYAANRVESYTGDIASITELVNECKAVTCATCMCASTGKDGGLCASALARRKKVRDRSLLTVCEAMRQFGSECAWRQGWPVLPDASGKIIPAMALPCTITK